MEVTADDIKARWGEQLQRARRDEAHLTQLQLAVRLGWDPQTVSRIERGMGSLDAFVTAANALGVELVR
jgi:transcriptional regulator with XRE-family HTH domain